MCTRARSGDARCSSFHKLARHTVNVSRCACRPAESSMTWPRPLSTACALVAWLALSAGALAQGALGPRQLAHQPARTASSGCGSGTCCAWACLLLLSGLLRMQAQLAAAPASLRRSAERRAAATSTARQASTAGSSQEAAALGALRQSCPRQLCPRQLWPRRRQSPPVRRSAQS
jgi:hypothetical protein